MKTTFFIRTVLCMFLILTVVSYAAPQEKKYDTGLSYTTEIQSDFAKKINWVNLLTLDGAYRPWKNGEFSVQTISVYKTRKERIINDLQTFSNIEEDNMALNFSLLGYTHRFKSITIFGGIRNLNHDYFTGYYTSLLTNSSCGIYPTISCNYPVPNYPLSAMALHAEFDLSEKWRIKNSLYNGVAGKLCGNGPPVFDIRPKRDGIMNVTEISYTNPGNKYGLYSLGAVYHSPYYIDDETGVLIRTKNNYTFWGSIEQSLYNAGNRSVGLLLHSSFAPADRNECRSYFGGGIILQGFISSKRQDIFGLFANRADFGHKAETAIEFTWRYEIMDWLYVQPAVHHIITGGHNNTVGLLRVVFTLNR